MVLTQALGNSDGFVAPRSAARRDPFAAFKAKPSQLTGAVIDGRYKIHGYLRQGPTLRVYLAEELGSGGSVVIKMLAPEAANNAELRERIALQARTATAVSHPNVVDLLGVGETPAGVPYLVMEAMAGEPLDELLRRKQRLPLDLALVLARQAALGLEAIHDARIVHGDVKPGNLMVLGAPKEPYGVKVIDYGIARLWDETLTADAVLGAVEYMAPEQILAEAVETRSDIYSLGVVFFRMLTGHLPFEAPRGGTVLKHQLFSPVPPPSWLDDTLDPRLEAVILNATRKHLENRYPKMQDLLLDLAAVLGLSEREVAVRPLARLPDVYEPQTDRGREALALLLQRIESEPLPASFGP